VCTSCVITHRGCRGVSGRLSPAGSGGDFVGGVQDPELDIAARLDSAKLVHCREAWKQP
jgi:hypothetical protein